MKVLLSVLCISSLVAVTECSPLFARKFTDWRNPWTEASYRERLQSWGLYPKVFRYGTTNHHAAMMERKRAELNWLKRLTRENEEAREPWSYHEEMASGETLRRRRQYEKLKERHFQKMEQAALEVLWQHR